MFRHHLTLLSLLLALLMTPLLPVTAQAACDPEVDHITKAELARSAGNYTAALAAYDCALAIDPENPGILFEQGLTALLLPDVDYDALMSLNTAIRNDYSLLENALTASTAAVAENPDDLATLTRHGYLLWRSIEDEAAIDTFNAILEIDPANVFATLFRGSSNQYLGNTEAAVTDFEAAVALSPDNAGLYTFIAETYSNSDDNDSAIRYYTGAIAIEPRNASLYLWRADAYEMIGDYIAADNDMLRALNLRPTDASIRENIGWTFMLDGRYAEAIPMLSSALVFDNTQPYTYLARGIAMTAMGNTRSGAQDFQAYFNLNQTATQTASLSDGSVTLTFEPGQVYQVPFQASAGDAVTINVTSEDGSVDPVLLLHDTAGIPLIGNDDIVPTVEFNAEITALELPDTGEYTILVTHAGAGNAGDVILTVTIE